MRLFISKRVLLDTGVITDAGILVDDGKIKKVLPRAEYIRYMTEKLIKTDDFGDSLIMPGVIDSHVHINQPGRTDWEGFETATKAAATGGVTPIIDMPLNSIPPTTTVANLNEKMEAAKKSKIYVDVGFWGGVIPGNEKDLVPLVKAGVVGFKCFLCPSGVDEFPNVTPKQVEIAMKALKDTNTVLAFHAELDLNKTYNTEHPEKYETYLKTRPPEMEVDAIKVIIDLAYRHNIRTHIVHLSAADALLELKAAREKDTQISVETCHHYLTLVAEDVPDNHTEFKCAPPVRSEINREALWQAIKEGHIDMVVSDHSPSTPDLKYLEPDQTPDFLKAWGGIASVQFGLSLFWTGAKARGLNLYDVSRLLTAGPAKLVGLQNLKGALKEGYDADLVVWDPEKEIEIEDSRIEFKNKATPYLGMKFYGKVRATIVRGKIVYRNEDDYVEYALPSGRLVLREE